ncbi:glutathione-disulfide reductase [Leptolyngbya sp. FACHB-261]|uniref:glutathione-disulfide reductase n=1 Tax=Leptolyngbya sp. FACHB-261 TaxID=2692806 RepID=UPI0016836920|nr:glutathione-disulfide reductase [Leptolyngbya sp. FACHB-261]MBD2101981.1 glutathione-disulfide reductase [Leptolyngbya sp. FACHB-261]
MAFDYDLLIIGAGSGGMAAARVAVECGAKVALVEQEAIGGTCVNRGCIPMKLLDYASRFSRLYQEAKHYGWTVANQFDWSSFMAAKDQEVQHINQAKLSQLEQAGIELIKGQACFVDEHTVEIISAQASLAQISTAQSSTSQTTNRISAEKILLAVGSKPFLPHVPGIEHAITSEEMFRQKRQPQQIAIVGGGYIGVGFASALNGLGSQVTLLVLEDQILSGWDDDIRNIVSSGMTQRGVQIWCGTKVENIEPEGNFRLTLSGDHPSFLLVDTLLYATGRIPNTDGLALEKAGVKLGEKGAVVVDEQYRTNQPHIFAIGDCINRVELTPVAVAEGRAFAEQEFGSQRRNVNYDWVPAAVTCQPEAATIGLTEAQAREKLGDAVQCHRREFQPLFYSFSPEREPTLMKLIVDGSQSEKVIGAHIVGRGASEIVQSVGLALKMGATLNEFEAHIPTHPTSAEELFSHR